MERRKQHIFNKKCMDNKHCYGLLGIKYVHKCSNTVIKITVYRIAKEEWYQILISTKGFWD